VDHLYNIGLAYERVALMSGSDAALRFSDGYIVSHGELDTLANRVAALLATRGVGRRDVIGIVHSKSAVCFASMLAALKLGAAYVNLDDQNPGPRLRLILDSARPKIIIGESLPAAIEDAFTASTTAVLDLETAAARNELAAASAEEPLDVRLVTGSDPAYIMYTSGSTGVPKGAIITHANVLNFAAWAGARFDIGRADVLSNVNPMYFDNSVFDFYAALLNGASMAPVSRDAAANPAAMLEQLEQVGCSIWFSVPSLLIYLTTLKLLNDRSLPAVRSVIFGGEGYPKTELRKLFAVFGSRSRLINVYGPTECTCMASARDVQASDLDDVSGFVPLGAVADNFTMLVLNADGRPVGHGETGELCLLGPQIGLGYVNDPERTRSAFVRNPANAAWYEPMYRTGDLVRILPDGRCLDFVGRRDNQIKHMGYRIELEEIEAALNRIDGVVQSAVLQRTQRSGRSFISAYVAADVDLTEQTLRTKLGHALPPYMIPQRFQLRSMLPTNANGKVDRLALAAEETE
jgi:amino acid adenylation domain-containing protein